MEALQKKQLGRKGFTLIELIVVIAIIAILAVILIPRFVGFTQSANEKAAISDTRNILVAVQALEAQGAATIDQAAVESYTGVASFAGTMSAYTLGSGDFTYAYATGGKTYTVTVTNYQISTTVAVA